MQFLDDLCLVAADVSQSKGVSTLFGILTYIHFKRVLTPLLIY